MGTYNPRLHSTAAFTTAASTTLFRRLTWEGTVPLEIRVDPKELPANSDRGLECYYMQAPRVSYLPLLMPEIKKFLMDVVFDEIAASTLREEDWWFESEEGTLLKWCILSHLSSKLPYSQTLLYIQALASWSNIRQSHDIIISTTCSITIDHTPQTRPPSRVSTNGETSSCT